MGDAQTPQLGRPDLPEGVGALVERLRCPPNSIRPTLTDGRAAADALEALAADNAAKDAEIARLREALDPFAKLLKSHHDDLTNDTPVFGIEDSIICVGDMRRACTVLQEDDQ